MRNFAVDFILWDLSPERLNPACKYLFQFFLLLLSLDIHCYVTMSGRLRTPYSNLNDFLSSSMKNLLFDVSFRTTVCNTKKNNNNNAVNTVFQRELLAEEPDNLL